MGHLGYNRVSRSDGLKRGLGGGVFWQGGPLPLDFQKASSRSPVEFCIRLFGLRGCYSPNALY